MADIESIILDLEEKCADEGTNCAELARYTDAALLTVKKTAFCKLIDLLMDDDRKRNTPFYHVSKLIAAELDAKRDPTSKENIYHNHTHFKEVMLSAFVLSQIAQRQGIDVNQGKLICAALIHDIAHDGGKNFIKGKRVPFKLEDAAVDYAVPFMQKAGFDSDAIDSMRYIIRKTDLGGQGKDMQKAYPNGINAEDDKLGVILSDADLLAGVGLTGSRAFINDEKIKREWNAPYLPADFEHFVNDIFCCSFRSEPGKFFNPNIQENVLYMKSIVVKKYDPNRAIVRIRLNHG